MNDDFDIRTFRRDSDETLPRGGIQSPVREIQEATPERIDAVKKALDYISLAMVRAELLTHYYPKHGFEQEEDYVKLQKKCTLLAQICGEYTDTPNAMSITRLEYIGYRSVNGIKKTALLCNDTGFEPPSREALLQTFQNHKAGAEKCADALLSKQGVASLIESATQTLLDLNIIDTVTEDEALEQETVVGFTAMIEAAKRPSPAQRESQPARSMGFAQQLQKAGKADENPRRYGFSTSRG